jgi:mannose-6-phosphate isomerase-like protein (cupin superfamily)
MRIFLDIDNTICKTGEGEDKYYKSIPIKERIDKANKLYDEGHNLTYWTARGGNSGIDWKELTIKQLNEWECKYHELIMGKPAFDLFIDDKCCNCDEWLPLSKNERYKKGEFVPKGWGHELIIENNEKYCGKILHFKEGGKFSMHFHLLKQETWYVQSGIYKFLYIDTTNADLKEMELVKGDIITNYIGQPHQIICIEEGDIFEVSTQHFDSDSYRVFKGDSQNKQS